MGWIKNENALLAAALLNELDWARGLQLFRALCFFNRDGPYGIGEDVKAKSGLVFCFRFNQRDGEIALTLASSDQSAIGISLCDLKAVVAILFAPFLLEAFAFGLCDHWVP